MSQLNEIDFTEIRDPEIRTVICDLMSAMLDNPDKFGIFSTSEFMWKMESYCIGLRAGAWGQT